MKKFGHIIASDTVLIIFSILSAILLWYYGYTINNPFDTKTYHLDLELLNTDKLDSVNKFLRNMQSLDNTTIDVLIRAPRNTLKELSEDYENGSLVAYIDFAVSDLLYAPESITFVETSVQVKLPSKYAKQDDPNNTVTIINRDPLTVTVHYDKIITTTLNIISPTLTNLELPENFEITNIVCNPKEATARGPSTEINNISKFIVDLSFTNKDLTSEGMPNDYTDIGRLIAVDRSQQPITDNITLDISEVEVSYSVKKEKQLQILPPTLIGVPAEGYALHPLEPIESYTPKTINIKGPKEDVDSAINIKLKPIDISGMTSDDTLDPIELHEYLWDISKQLEFVNMNNTDIIVQPRIELKVSKEYYYFISRIDTINYDPETMQIPSGTLTPTLTVQSVKSLMDTFSLFNDVQASVDCTELIGQPPGEYELPVTITLNKGYNLLSEEPRLTVTVIDPNAEEAPDYSTDNNADIDIDTNNDITINVGNQSESESESPNQSPSETTDDENNNSESEQNQEQGIVIPNDNTDTEDNEDLSE